MTVIDTPPFPGAGILRPVFNAIDYGADPLGIVDSTVALQTFLNACMAAGNRGYIPAGKYLVSSALSITSPLMLEGAGAPDLSVTQGTRIFTTTVGINLLNLSTASGSSGGSIRGIAFDGNSKAAVGVNITGALTTKWSFYDCVFENCTHLGVYLLANHTFDFFHCRFNTNGVTSNTVNDGGVQVDGANVVNFWGCDSENNSGCGFIFSNGFMIGIHGGAIEANGWHGVYGLNLAQHVVIENVDFELNNTGSHASTRNVNISTINNSYWELRDCKFTGTTVDFHVWTAGWFNIWCNLRTGDATLFHVDGSPLGFTCIGQDLTGIDSTSIIPTFSQFLGYRFIDNRSGITTADGSPITLVTLTARTKQLFDAAIEIDATAFTSGTATYTMTYTENGVSQTIVVTATVINVVTGVRRLIQPDPSTIVTVQLTGAFVATCRLSAALMQLA